MYVEKAPFNGHPDINTWLRARNHPEPSEFPEHGYIAYDRGEPIACAFLRHVEGDYAFFDGLASNPDADSGMRDWALSLVIRAVMQCGKELGYKGIMATSSDVQTIKRACSHGFSLRPEVFLVANFT